MRVVDEDGRLFGRVNVYDALVVLLVLGGLVAGVAILDPFGGDRGEPGDGDRGEPATRYATVVLGEQPPAVAERIAAGDVAAGGAPGADLAVTDTYVGPADDGNLSVVVRVRVDGTLVGADGGDGGTVTFAGDPLRYGAALVVETAGHEARGEVVELAAEGATLDTGTRRVLVAADLGASTAAVVDRGDAYRVGGRTVATVESVVVDRGANRTAGVDLVGLTLRTVRYGGSTYFGADRVLVGRTVSVRTERYAFSGTVSRLGSASPRGEPVERTVVVRAANVSPGVADDIEAGLVDRRGGTAVARVTDVRTEPASVVLTGEDGHIYERDHPRNEDVYLTVEVRVRATDRGLHFRTQRMRAGTTLYLDFGTVSVRGTVIEIRA